MPVSIGAGVPLPTCCFSRALWPALVQISAAVETRLAPAAVTRTTGVWPRRPQVRPLSGLRPLSAFVFEAEPGAQVRRPLFMTGHCQRAPPGRLTALPGSGVQVELGLGGAGQFVGRTGGWAAPRVEPYESGGAPDVPRGRTVTTRRAES